MCASKPRQAYTTVHKGGWGSGPWRDELDKAVWTDPATGLDCMYRRCDDGGYLCGYVAVEAGHPLFGFSHDAIPAALEVTAHRGLNESGPCDHGHEAKAMCHIPAAGRPEDVWWFGFKCDGLGDDKPQRRQMGSEDRSGVYRSVEYVRGQCAALAARLGEIALDAVVPKVLPGTDMLSAPLRVRIPA